VAAGTSTCRACGFVLFEAPARRRLPRRALTVSLAVLAAVAAAAVLLTRDPRREVQEPIPATQAAQRLERQLRSGGVTDLGAVRCPGAVRPRRFTRCHASYTDGDTQLLLVTLTPTGEPDIQNPYPAQRRPGG
jgi:hypothetical protein